MAEDKQTRKLREKVEKALEGNKNEQAAELLEQLMELEPKNVRWAHKRGDLLRKLGRNQDALGCYEAAVQIYADQGFIARAVAMAKTVLNIDPSRIDILERVDPNAAQQLHRQQRAGAMSAPEPARRHSAIIGGDTPLPPPPSAARKHPMVLDDDAPMPAAAPAPSAAKKHPMVLDDDAPMPAAAPAASAAKPRPAAPAAGPPPLAAKAVRQSAPEPAAVQRPPLPAKPQAPRAPEPAPAAVPPPLAGRAVAPAAQPAQVAPPPRKRARPITLDKISLPPAVRSLNAATPVAIPAAARVPDAAEIYGQALHEVDELTADPSAPANETRFSNAPPRRRGISVEFTKEELEPRELVPEIESQRPAPPSAQKLSSLPLFPLFAEVPKDALTEMIAGTDLIELAHGDYVMRKGDPGDALYGIVEGSVGVIVPGQGVRLTLAEGDVFGESCLLQDEKRHADVVVEGKLVALRVPREVLTRLLGRHPKLAEVLLELLTRRLLGNLLQSSPLFQEFDATGRRELARMFEIRRAPAGTMLAIVGKKMDGIYISLTGTLAVNQPGAPERIAPPGVMFGQSALLSNDLSQVDVKARVNMVVLRLPSAAFSKVAMQYPTILARLAELSTSEVVKNHDVTRESDEPSLYDELGGETKLRAVIDDFVERVFADVMIGFFFRDANKDRIKIFELQHAGEFLGGPQRYRGRPLTEAHKRHRIMGGQFARRSQILREVLAAHGVSQRVTAAWLAHVESLRSEVTTDPDGQCNP